MSGTLPPEESGSLEGIIASAFRICPCGIAILDDQGRFLGANAAWSALTGYQTSELASQAYVAALVETTRLPRDSEAALAELEPLGPVEQRLRRKDGSVAEALVAVSAPVELEGRRVRFLAAFGIGELKRRDVQTRNAEKMDAVGRLAAGAAHSLNNLLTIITGYTQLLRNELDPSQGVWGYADEIRRAADSAAALAGKMLIFSRRRLAKLERLELGDVLLNLEPGIRANVRANCELRLDFEPQPIEVVADRLHVEQVVYILVQNACEAMPLGGRLTIRTGLVEFTEEGAKGYDLRPGRYALLAVEDTGGGIDPEAAKHLFEPFFSTKGTGKGTGLAMVYGAVKQCGGEVEVASEQGRGTTVAVYLPLAE